MKCFPLCLLAAIIAPAAVAFTSVQYAKLIHSTSSSSTANNCRGIGPTLFLSALPSPEDDTVSFPKAPTTAAVIDFSSLVVAGITTGLMSFASCALAGEDIEMAELPPPYVPALFAVALLAGVGVLTGSLGNVMDEGSNIFIFVRLALHCIAWLSSSAYRHLKISRDSNALFVLVLVLSFHAPSTNKSMNIH